MYFNTANVITVTSTHFSALLELRHIWISWVRQKKRGAKRIFSCTSISKFCYRLDVFSTVKQLCKGACPTFQNLVLFFKDHHFEYANLKFQLKWSNRLAVVSNFAYCSCLYNCYVNFIPVTIYNQTLFINIFQIHRFSVVKFNMRYEKNMSFLVIRKSPKVGNKVEKIGLNSFKWGHNSSCECNKVVTEILAKISFYCK